MLSELFETLPEVGDADKPKLVFFFDEAHLLFDSAPKNLMTAIEQVVRLMVGLIAVGFVVYHYGRELLKLTPSTSNSIGAGVFWGGVSGYTSFVAHAGSPPYQVYMMPQRLPPQLYAGTATMFFAVTNFIKAISYFSLGQFTSDNLQTSLILMPLAIAATFGGVWLVRRFDKEKFYTLVYAMTFLIGCKLIADSL
jgi:uncharacterized membrane protein YfcA